MAGTKPISGIISAEASNTAEPKAWVCADMRDPTVLFDRRADLGPRALPAWDLVHGAEPVGERDGTIERDPAHQLGVQEMLRSCAHFPDALVGSQPVRRGAVSEVYEEPAGRFVELAELESQPVGGVQEVAVDVEL